MSAVAERSALRTFERPTWRSPAQLATTVIGLAAGWILLIKFVMVTFAVAGL